MNDFPKLTSLANPRIKELAKLKPSEKAFLVEGFHLVEMAYLHGCLDEVYLGEGASLPYSPKKGFSVTKEIIEKISSSKTPEPVVGLCHYERKETKPFRRAVILDRVQDPGNVGAILRSAIAFGFSDVYFLPGTCSPFNEKAIASSQGALFPLALHFVENGEALVDSLQKEGVRVYATALRDAVPLETFSINKEERMAFILGNEGKGVSPSMLEKSDARLFIQMEGIESLNVSVAAGILFHHVYAL